MWFHNVGWKPTRHFSLYDCLFKLIVNALIAVVFELLITIIDVTSFSKNQFIPTLILSNQLSVLKAYQMNEKRFYVSFPFG